MSLGVMVWMVLAMVRFRNLSRISVSLIHLISLVNQYLYVLLLFISMFEY